MEAHFNRLRLFIKFVLKNCIRFLNETDIYKDDRRALLKVMSKKILHIMWWLNKKYNPYFTTTPESCVKTMLEPYAKTKSKIYLPSIPLIRPRYYTEKSGNKINFAQSPNAKTELSPQLEIGMNALAGYIINIISIVFTERIRCTLKVDFLSYSHTIASRQQEKSLDCALSFSDIHKIVHVCRTDLDFIAGELYIKKIFLFNVKSCLKEKIKLPEVIVFLMRHIPTDIINVIGRYLYLINETKNGTDIVLFFSLLAIYVCYFCYYFYYYHYRHCHHAGPPPIANIFI